jgi:hypothetical protein
MAKPQRSPVLGYNHNVRYHGRVFHIQTEDSGPGNPRLFTHLFFEGTILQSTKQEYDPELHEDAVKLAMQRLHKSMIKDLSHGDFDVKLAAFFEARGEAPVVPDPPRAPLAAPLEAVLPARVDTLPVGVPVVTGEPNVHAAAAAARAAAGDRSRGPVVPGVTPRPMVVVKPGELRRSPFVLTSPSADGVVVQRNVVVGAAGSGTPSPTRPVRIRPPVPYVVREGSYQLTTAGGRPSAGAGAAASGSVPPAQAQAAASNRDVRMPWESPGASEQSSSGDDGKVDMPADSSGTIPLGMPAPGAQPLQARGASPSEKPFSADLVSDKSLDEVILEYLSDDGET